IDCCGLAFSFSPRRAILLSWQRRGGSSRFRRLTNCTSGASLCASKTLAAFQRAVPMISGRGLGITGGTLDKLESIPGFNINLDERRALKQLQCIGVFMIRQTTDICPADKKKLYALRDVTGNRAFAIVHCREHHEQEAGGKSRPVG